MGLREDVDTLRREGRYAAEQYAAAKRTSMIEQVGNAIRFTFGEDAEAVEWNEALRQPVALLDTLGFALSYGRSPTPSLHVVCTCLACGDTFLSGEDFGSDKEHYGRKNWDSPEEKAKRRTYALERIAKVVNRDFQPNGYGHDHVCHEGIRHEYEMLRRKAEKAGFDLPYLF